MTTDLWMLVWTGVLSLMLPPVYLIGRMQTPGGMDWAMGNRDADFKVPPFAARAQRAHANLTENLAPFAILVLAAHLGGKANELTALGATIFFFGRIAHAALYTGGIILWRTIAYFVAMGGEVLILTQLFR